MIKATAQYPLRGVADLPTKIVANAVVNESADAGVLTAFVCFDPGAGAMHTVRLWRVVELAHTPPPVGEVLGLPTEALNGQSQSQCSLPA
ncbi:MAG: hypothetical protein AAFX44_06760 [Pseudomonadota bacterium]